MENILLKRGRSVNYFANLRTECHFSKIGCNESNFSKRIRCQCNLPIQKKKKKDMCRVVIGEAKS
jgi:phosphoribosylaminoimidazole carboxylase (NCAIR synthetase)